MEYGAPMYGGYNEELADVFPPRIEPINSDYTMSSGESTPTDSNNGDENQIEFTGEYRDQNFLSDLNVGVQLSANWDECAQRSSTMNSDPSTSFVRTFIHFKNREDLWGHSKTAALVSDSWIKAEKSEMPKTDTQKAVILYDMMDTRLTTRAERKRFIRHFNELLTDDDDSVSSRTDKTSFSCHELGFILANEAGGTTVIDHVPHVRLLDFILIVDILRTMNANQMKHVRNYFGVK